MEREKITTSSLQEAGLPVHPPRSPRRVRGAVSY